MGLLGYLGLDALRAWLTPRTQTSLMRSAKHRLMEGVRLEKEKMPLDFKKIKTAEEIGDADQLYQNFLGFLNDFLTAGEDILYAEENTIIGEHRSLKEMDNIEHEIGKVIEILQRARNPELAQAINFFRVLDTKIRVLARANQQIIADEFKNARRQVDTDQDIMAFLQNFQVAGLIQSMRYLFKTRKEYRQERKDERSLEKNLGECERMLLELYKHPDKPKIQAEVMAKLPKREKELDQLFQQYVSHLTELQKHMQQILRECTKLYIYLMQIGRHADAEMGALEQEEFPPDTLQKIRKEYGEDGQKLLLAATNIANILRTEGKSGGAQQTA